VSPFQFKSTYSIGIFAGVVFVMSNQMLLVFALFVQVRLAGQESRRRGGGEGGDDVTAPSLLCLLPAALSFSVVSFSHVANCFN
jgi:hypothetical protein